MQVANYDGVAAASWTAHPMPEKVPIGKKPKTKHQVWVVGDTPDLPQ
jgi:hypothetical protein